MGQYLPILAMMVLGTLFAGLSLVASRILQPPRPNDAKNSPYECGIVDQADPPERFPVRFYLAAMIFIIVDIEIVFLYPYATVYEGLGRFGLFAVLSFATAVFASFLYLIANGALDWGPAKDERERSGMVDRERTPRTTIRRVGTEGRGPAIEDEAA